MASQITSVSIIDSTVCSGEDQRKHQSSASLVFVMAIHRWPVNSPQKGPVTRKMLPFDDVTGSDNGLSPGRCQTIIWTNPGILLHFRLRPNAFENVVCEISFHTVALKAHFAWWHIYVSIIWVMIASGDGLAYTRCQAITWINAAFSIGTINNSHNLCQANQEPSKCPWQASKPAFRQWKIKENHNIKSKLFQKLYDENIWHVNITKSIMLHFSYI